MRPRIVNQGLKSARKPALVLCLECVIVRRWAVGYEVYSPEVGIRSRAGNSLIQALGGCQLSGGRANIGKCHRLPGPQGLLYGDVPLQSVRKSKVRIYCIKSIRDRKSDVRLW